MNSTDLETPVKFRISPRLIVGFGILALGILWTLDNLDILESGAITRWWPVLLIVLGLSQFTDRRTTKVGPSILIVIGSLLVLERLHVIVRLRQIFPLFLALIGAKLIWDALGRRARPVGDLVDPDSTIHAFAFLSGVKRQSTTPAFQGGDVNAIMGGVELDLRNSQLSDGQEVIVDAFALWGGIEIFVPPHWRVAGNVMPLMGTFQDKTTASQGTTGPVLNVRGTAVMGGIEVKN